MIAFAYSEAVLEGEEGWARNKKVWRFKISRNHDYTSYHVVTYYILFPILLFVLPSILVGFSWRLTWILLISYLIGTILEDFMWFVFNPYRPFYKWNHVDTTWYPWIKVGRFALPLSYVTKLFLAAVVFVYFIR